ncbi:MAG: hypothetical protein ABSB19_12930 [Methylomonas sp.]
MSIRTFVFCDICNPQGIRTIEFRRSTRLDMRGGRRISDGRAWLETALDQTMADAGWLRTVEGLHICPACQSRQTADSE